MIQNIITFLIFIQNIITLHNDKKGIVYVLFQKITSNMPIVTNETIVMC